MTGRGDAPLHRNLFIMLRNSLIREMSFKANFLLWMIVEVLWFCGQIVFFSIISGRSIASAMDEMGSVLLVGTHQMIAQLFQAFFFVNVANIPNWSVPENWIRCSFCH